MQKNSKLQEVGRTLLETITVLVVIAILFIATILGYNTLRDRMKRQDTIKKITELGVKYKLTPIKPKDTKIPPIKSIYPGSDIEGRSKIKTSDNPDGRVFIEANADKLPSFSVVAESILNGTCQELLESGNYEAFVYKDDKNNEKVITKKAFDTMTDKAKKDKIIRSVCGVEEITHNMRLVYGEVCLDGASWYDDACHRCDANQKEDVAGNCCNGELDACGYCPEKCICDAKTKTCVECTNDSDCKEENKPHCNSKTHTCVGCTEDKDCTGAKDKCDLSTNTCTDCTEGFGVKWNAELGICDCESPLLPLNASCSSESNCCASRICDNGKCKGCLRNKGEEGAGACTDPDHPICKEGECKACPVTPAAENDECYEVCGGCPSGKGLRCNTAENKCKCSGEGTYKHWSSDKKMCVQCTENSHCSGDTPWCDPSDNTCKKCQHSYGTGSFSCPSTLPWCDAGVCRSCAEDKTLRDEGKVWDSANHVCVDCNESIDCPENKGCLNKSCVNCNQAGTGIRAKDKANCYCPDGMTKRIGSTSTSVGYYDGGAWICGTGCGDHTDCGENEHCSCTACSGGKCIPCSTCTYREKDDATDCKELTNCPPKDENSSSCKDDEKWEDAACTSPCSGSTTEDSCKACLKDSCKETCQKNGNDCRDCIKECEEKEDELSCLIKCKTRNACNNEEKECLKSCKEIQEGWTEEGCKPICKNDEVYLSYNAGANTCSDPKCTKVPSKDELVRKEAIYNNKHFYIPPAEAKYRMTHESASRFCKHYGLHLAKVDEACAKDYAYDSGWDCPNFVSVKEFDDRGKTHNLYTWGESIDYDGGMGTFWLANLADVYGLRVTYTCGNNHSSHICNNFYPLCTD